MPLKLPICSPIYLADNGKAGRNLKFDILATPNPNPAKWILWSWEIILSELHICKPEFCVDPTQKFRSTRIICFATHVFPMENILHIDKSSVIHSKTLQIKCVKYSYWYNEYENLQGNIIFI